MGTLTSAVSSKRSMASGGMGSNLNLGPEIAMPMSVTGRTGTAASVQSNILTSDRRPLNVINQV